MRWPWSRSEPEERASSFTTQFVNALVDAAGGNSAGDPGGIAALEAAVALYARAFAAAKITRRCRCSRRASWR